MAAEDIKPLSDTPTLVTLDRGLRRLRAPNPSPMTERGTNTYLLGESDLAVIDPGPDLDGHLAAILAALEPHQTITHIIVTHAHRDHASLSRRLGAATGACVFAHGPALSGRSPAMIALAEAGLIEGGEGVDTGFVPDRRLADGDTLCGSDWRLTALWTPGHMGNHLCLAWNDCVFCGDLVMGWATSLVSPPDGDMAAFMASCRRLRLRGARRLFAGHGAPIEDPDTRLRDLLAHRRQRERQIMDTLTTRPTTLTALTQAIYTDVDPALLPAAARNVFAHLIDLKARGQITAAPAATPKALFARVA